MKSKLSIFNSLFWLVASGTLGLAPFSPEPHIWEKMKWIVVDAGGMKAIDWFDVVLHGTPWIMLFISVALWFKHK